MQVVKEKLLILKSQNSANLQEIAQLQEKCLVYQVRGIDPGFVVFNGSRG